MLPIISDYLVKAVTCTFFGFKQSETPVPAVSMVAQNNKEMLLKRSLLNSYQFLIKIVIMTM